MDALPSRFLHSVQSATMPLHAEVVGAIPGSLIVELDRRWTMAFAAGVPDDSSVLYGLDGDVKAHPLFPVAPEWQLVVQGRATGTGLTRDEVRRGIHVSHDLVVHRQISVGEQVRLEARTVAVDSRRAGATQSVLFTATAADGSVVWRTLNVSLFLGVELVGEPTSEHIDWPADPRRVGSKASVSDLVPLAVLRSEVRMMDAHVYSECARIWNPIHTDPEAARSAGLPAPILHGTATLARTVSLIANHLGVPVENVRRIAGHFAAPVDLGSTIVVRILSMDEDSCRFDVLNASTNSAIRDGLIVW